MPGHGLLKDQRVAQKQALRRYRKALAQIACNKWMQFAAGRLTAFRHHRRKLQAITLAALASSVQQSRRAQRGALVLRTRVNYRRLCDTISAWRQTAQRLQHTRRLTLQFQYKHTQSRLASVLYRWHAWTLLQHRKQRLCCKAQFFRDFVLSSHAMCALRQHILRRHHKARQLVIARCHFCRKQLVATWRGWRANVVRQKSKRRQFRTAVQHFQQTRQRRCLHAIADLVRCMRAARMTLVSAWQRAAAQHQIQFVSVIVREWQAISKHRQVVHAQTQLLSACQHQALQHLVCTGCAADFSSMIIRS